MTTDFPRCVLCGAEAKTEFDEASCSNRSCRMYDKWLTADDWCLLMGQRQPLSTEDVDQLDQERTVIVVEEA